MFLCRRSSGTRRCRGLSRLRCSSGGLQLFGQLVRHNHLFLKFGDAIQHSVLIDIAHHRDQQIFLRRKKNCVRKRNEAKGEWRSVPGCRTSCESHELRNKTQDVRLKVLGHEPSAYCVRSSNRGYPSTRHRLRTAARCSPGTELHAS